MVRITAVVSFSMNFFAVRRFSCIIRLLAIVMHVVSQTGGGLEVHCLSHAHFNRWTFITFRCQCEHCGGENLASAREFRCCREVANASRILTFDGSIERMSCVTQHEDYTALTNRTVLLQVAPLLRDKEGRKYRRRSDVPENE